MPNFRGNEDLCKLWKEYLNDLLCKFGPFCLQHSKTFDISHAFLQVTIAEISTLKQVRFFGPPCSMCLAPRQRLVALRDFNIDMANIAVAPGISYSSDFQPGFRGTQGFCEHLPRVPQPASKNDLACEITPDSVAKILGIFPFVLIRFYVSFLHRLTVLNHFCC